MANSSAGRVLGTVKWFDDVRAFGFIVPEDGGKDIYVHADSAPLGGLRRGDVVDFEIESNLGGNQDAKAVLRIDASNVVARACLYDSGAAASIRREPDEVAKAYTEAQRLGAQLLQAVDSESFDLIADALCDLGNSLPRNRLLIREVLYSIIQDVDRRLALASGRSELSPNIRRFYRRVLDSAWALSNEQLQSIGDMLLFAQAAFDDVTGDVVTSASADPGSKTFCASGCLTSCNETAKIESKIDYVLAQRTTRFVIVLEGIANMSNKFGIFRSCEALGVAEVWIVLPTVKQKKSKGALNLISKRSQQWLEVRSFCSTSSCIAAARAEGRALWVTALHAKAQILATPLELPSRLAFVLGSEESGISAEMLHAADMVVRLPMCGFVESLNVGVAAAMCIQRLFDLCPEAHGDLPEASRVALREKWRKQLLFDKARGNRSDDAEDDADIQTRPELLPNLADEVLH